MLTSSFCRAKKAVSKLFQTCAKGLGISLFSFRVNFGLTCGLDARASARLLCISAEGERGFDTGMF